MSTLDANKAQVWNLAMAKMKLARDLCRDLLKICPDGAQDPDGATGNAAARAALRAAIDIIEHNPPKLTGDPMLDGYWAGLLSGATRIISNVEMEMYDPRSHPERYQ